MYCSSKSGCQAGSGSCVEEEEAEELERVELWRPAEEFGRSGRGTVSGGEGRE